MRLKFKRFQWLVILTWLITLPAHSEECIKTVFNLFCLGSDAQLSLGKLTTTISVQEVSPTKRLYSFNHLNKPHQLSSINGLIHSVSRHETPGNWINFIAWKVKLVRLYGRGTDASNFPLYATSRSSKLNAISSHKGHAEFQWQLEHYSISLIWDHLDFITLKYQLKELGTAHSNTPEGL